MYGKRLIKRWFLLIKGEVDLKVPLVGFFDDVELCLTGFFFEDFR
jgi:hypothetical protein